MTQEISVALMEQQPKNIIFLVVILPGSVLQFSVK